MTPQQAMDQARQLHLQGRLAQAENLYRQILSQQPNHSDALHMLGVIAHQVGKHDIALELIGRAIEINPAMPDYHVNRGVAMDALGRLEDAIAAMDRALVVQPEFPEALCNLGNMLRKKGDAKQAALACRRALAARPNYPEAYNNLGSALQEMDSLPEAIEAYGNAIAQRPKYADAHYNLGIVLQKSNRSEDAVASYRRALAIRPDFVDAHNNLGIALMDLDRNEEAEASYRRAIALRPEHAESHNNLGIVLCDMDREDEAIESCRRALALRPNFADAHNHLGNAFHSKGDMEQAIASYHKAISLRPDSALMYDNLAKSLHQSGKSPEAIALCRKAISIDPENAEVHWDLALMSLLRGDFHQGWREYEWRWKAKKHLQPVRRLREPQWAGLPLEGKRILIYAEQGFGDTIQFIRYLPMVAQRGGKILAVVQPELLRLLLQLDGVEQWLLTNDPLPEFDLHCPLLSLPGAFDTTLETIPAKTPYLRADPEDARQWRTRIPADKRLKVGIAWAGRPTHPEDRIRSIKPAMIEPLLRTDGVWFCSLQKSSSLPSEMGLTDWTADITDFADTAGLIANLDLLITVDTAVAHLAGAMGKRIWLLLPWVPDWRWLLDRDDSPWYPTMRLFRQSSRGDWEIALRQVAQELQTLARE